MSSTNWSRYLIVEAGLAVVVLTSAALSTLTSSARLSSGLETALVFGPATLLGSVSVLRLRTERRQFGSLLSGLLGVITLGLVGWSGLTLAIVSTDGVFFGGLFVLVAGTALAVTVLVRTGLRWRTLPPFSSDTAEPSDD